MPYEHLDEAATKNLHKYLRQLSYFENDINNVPVDGIFESATEEALRNYQRLRGLPETGEADQRTWELLYLDYVTSLNENSPPAPVYVFPRLPNDYTVGLGDEGFIVTVIQFLLRELLTLYGFEDSSVEPTEVFDAETEAAVKIFQQLHNLTPTGRVDKITWNNLAAAHRPTVERYQEE